MTNLIFEYIKNNPLGVLIFLVTSVLLYFYFMDKGTGAKLSKRYRDSIYEAQSKIYLNATKYLISGNRDMAIKEFINAVNLNRETIDTYFALGGLFRTNGEIDKAISIHRSLIARDNINEGTRLHALKELAKDFDKGGFVDKAIASYKDILKVNRDDVEVIKALCRVLEDTKDWEEALKYRLLLSKATNVSQSQTISHILVQKAEEYLAQENLAQSEDILEQSFRYSPSATAKILRLKICLAKGDLEKVFYFFNEFLKEDPAYLNFMFYSFDQSSEVIGDLYPSYRQSLLELKNEFMRQKQGGANVSPSLILSKIRLMENSDNYEGAYKLISEWSDSHPDQKNMLRVERLKILLKLDKKEEVFKEAEHLVTSLTHSLSRYFCRKCGHESDAVFWRCPQCHEWETIDFRWKV
jgi:lipopolysaccharide assembly protein B